ncbi:MAG: Holliday junction branch migration DNA helicase RuvB [Parasporobacterium sp.]|nr:Holliday junction branch migration DNA helicase RuvB [Parasporobacterium sp.]
MGINTTINPESNFGEIQLENNLRPKYLKDYIGQEKIRENLQIYIEAAKKRGEPLDHLLFYGPPGLGKTTLANIIANEMNTNIKIISGPAIEIPGEIASIISKLKEGDVLFIDEIHRLNKPVEETMYSAMEDFALDIVVGKGSMAQTHHVGLPRFTLIGATTRAGLLSAPLRDRFGVVYRMQFYEPEELAVIVANSARKLGVSIDKAGAFEIGRRSRGTPRIANRMLKRVRDYAQVRYDGNINAQITDEALNMLDIDKFGLDVTDRGILNTIIDKFAGGPVGLDTLAAALGEDAGTIEDVYEPYLVKCGFINRTPRGRVVTEKAMEHLTLNHD